MQKIETIKIWVWRVFALLLVTAIVIGVQQENWFNVGVGSIAFMFLVLPLVLERTFHIDLPSSFELAFLFFIYLSMYLGEINLFYEKFWWWDLFLHSLSGVLIALLGFIFAYLMHRDKRISLELTPLFLSLFSFTLSLSIGVLWEIFEYSMDVMFGLHMQKSGLADTMWDLIVNTLAAFVISLYAYNYMKQQKTPLKHIENWLNKMYSK